MGKLAKTELPAATARGPQCKTCIWFVTLDTDDQTQVTEWFKQAAASKVHWATVADHLKNNDFPVSAGSLSRHYKDHVAGRN